MAPHLAALLRAVAALASHLAAAPPTALDRPALDTGLELATDLIGLTRATLDPALPADARGESLREVVATASEAAALAAVCDRN